MKVTHHQNDSVLEDEIKILKFKKDLKMQHLVQVHDFFV